MDDSIGGARLVRADAQLAVQHARWLPDDVDCEIERALSAGGLAGLRRQADVLRRLSAVEGVPRLLAFDDAAGVLARRRLQLPTLDKLDTGWLAMPANAVRVAVAVVDVLAAVHACGVLVGDLHPGNVHVDIDRGTASLGGLSAAVSLDELAAGTHDLTPCLAALPFCAPEQARLPSTTIDVRLDFYAVGALLHWALSGGRRLFAEHDPIGLRQARLVGPALPLAASVGDDLKALVARLLAKSPDLRPRDAFELQAQLKACLTGIDEMTGNGIIVEAPTGDASARVSAFDPYTPRRSQVPRWPSSVRAHRQVRRRRIRALSERLDAAVRIAKLGLWEYDLTTGKVSWDDKMFELYGIERSAFNGRVEDWLVAVHPDELDEISRGWQAALAGEDEYGSSFRVRHGSDGWRHIRSLAQFVRAPDRTLERVLGINWDDTSEKLAAAALTQAKEVAETADRDKREFLARMSHEIRTPLNAIIGMTHLALTTDAGPKQRDYLQKVDRASQLLLRLLNDILDLSKVEAGMMEMETVAFDLNDVFAQLASLLESKADDKGLSLSFRLPTHVPTALVGDPLRLVQVLLNLCSNAIRFTDRGDVAVCVDVAERDAQTVLLKFTIRDSGVGMSDDTLRRLFRPFSQGDVSTHRHYGGSGLGLAISRQLVQLMQGQIEATSQLGQGSTFSFSARFTLAPGVKRVQRTDELLSSASLVLRDDERTSDASVSLRGLHVLLVEDNLLNQELALELLSRSGIAVTVAHDGSQAIDLLERGRFDLILMDCQMPVMSGYEAAERIRQQPRWQSIPIIAMTATAMVGDRERAFASGMNDHLSKPIDIHRMLSTIARWTAVDRH